MMWLASMANLVTAMLLDFLQQVHGAGRPHPDNMSHADPGALDLALIGFTTQLRGHFIDVGYTGGANRMPLGEQPARHIDWNTASDRGRAFIYQPTAFALAAQAEVLIVNNFRGSEAVVQFD